MKKFTHGGDIKTFAKNIKCDIDEVIDLSSNINFIKPSIKLDFQTLNISSYPNYDDIYKIIANKYKVKTSQIELFNGGSSAIFDLFRNLNLKSCIIYSPAYLEYKKACEVFDYELHLINRFDNIYKNIKPNSLVIFVNPSTPDGKLYDLKKLFKIWKKANATVLIDESFLDFTSSIGAISYLKEYKNLYILKSMTKFYSSAGIRIGTIISKQKNIIKLKKTQSAWKLSQFDISYLQEAIKDKAFSQKTLQITEQNKLFLEKILLKNKFVKKVYKSEANYFLVKLTIPAKIFQQKLFAYKIMIRDCSNFDFLNKYFIRVAVKDKKSLERFKKALDEMS